MSSSPGGHPPIFARAVKDPESPSTPSNTQKEAHESASICKCSIPSSKPQLFPRSPLSSGDPLTDTLFPVLTGLTPSTSGSAYLELSPPAPTPLLPQLTTPLPQRPQTHLCRPRPETPSPLCPLQSHLLLATTVKFAPFASRARRGYIRDASERDLGVHLETALRGVVIGERWPKLGVEVIVTVVEGEEEGWWGDEFAVGIGGGKGGGGWGLMGVLAGCITVASAAIADAGIDVVDLVSGGFAAIVRDPPPPGNSKGKGRDDTKQGQEELYTVLDPCPAEHHEIVAACVVGYPPGRDEITELWAKGEVGEQSELLVDKAVHSAVATGMVLREAVKEGCGDKVRNSGSKGNEGLKGSELSNEAEMVG